ncbi:hypothetical protein D0862_10488 [Hortaea werneckii]|uniref:Uncharacterized protein n=1 Tax=Hortaea werneckii TaxID=91943 RepID=A0A3M7FHU3_HORWE|nr:hypothetical protein D0862_10488 [Hortaea werneckii]
MDIAESLLPGVSSEDQLLFVICLIVVVTLDVIIKHCVGQVKVGKKKTRRCGKDIDPVVTLTAVSELKNLSSNERRQRALLEKIAEDTVCTREDWKYPHRTQVPKIVEKWLTEAKALEETILMVLSKQAKREYTDDECKYAAHQCKYTDDAYDADYWSIV